MKIGVLAETTAGEARVALTPDVCAKLISSGHSVWVETDAGVDAGMPDEAYADAGATVATRSEVLSAASVLLGIRGPGACDDPKAMLAELDSTHTLIALQDPLWKAALMPTLAHTGATTLSLELIPRTTLAQSMDVLSSQATVSGYEAVLLAAHRSPRLFPLLMTAAGTVPAARVLVLGAGVAGLQAIATARKLGALVSAYDIRSAAAEQIESLGAKAISLKLDTSSSETAGGYAKQQAADDARLQRDLLAPYIAAADVLITTAAIPGRRSPALATSEMIEGMKPGSVVVDLAAERGGNVELTQPDVEVEHKGVMILGPTNLASSSAASASHMFATNHMNLLKHLSDDDGELGIDLDDEITAGILLTRHGEVVHHVVVSELSS